LHPLGFCSVPKDSGQVLGRRGIISRLVVENDSFSLDDYGNIVFDTVTAYSEQPYASSFFQKVLVSFSGERKNVPPFTIVVVKFAKPKGLEKMVLVQQWVRASSRWDSPGWRVGFVYQPSTAQFLRSSFLLVIFSYENI